MFFRQHSHTLDTFCLSRYDDSEGFVTILGLLFFVCRLGHIYGILYQDGFGPKENPARAVGAMGSWALMAIAALACIF